MTVAVVERLNKSQCMDCPLGQNKVAFVERWPLVEVRLYLQVWSRSSTQGCRETNPASGQSGTQAL